MESGGHGGGCGRDCGGNCGEAGNGGGHCGEAGNGGGPCYDQGRSALGGSAVAEQYQRMCLEMGADFCFGENCRPNDEEDNDRRMDQGGKGDKDFYCFRAEVEYDEPLPTTEKPIFCDCSMEFKEIKKDFENRIFCDCWDQLVEQPKDFQNRTPCDCGPFRYVGEYCNNLAVSNSQ